MRQGREVHPFRRAVERGDFDALTALLAPDVRFLSPVAFSPYEGRPLVAAILRGVGRVLEDLRYVRELEEAGDGAGGGGLALMFTARLGDRTVHGCDFLQFDASGLVAELCVMVRPLSAAQALGEAMGDQFDRIRREAAAAADAPAR